MSAVTGVSPATLATKAGRLAPLKPDALDRVRHEALTVPSEWAVEYGEYQSGGWQTLSLYHDTGTTASCPSVSATGCTSRSSPTAPPTW